MLSSDQYAEKAEKAIQVGEPRSANTYASLAIAAAIKESAPPRRVGIG